MKSVFERTYEGGNEGNLLYSQRPYVKVGTDYADVFRGVFIVDANSQISSALQSVSSYETGNPYSKGNANTTLTLASGQTGVTLYAFMLPLNAQTQTSVSWTKPFESSTSSWANDGGDIEPLASEISVQGAWNGSKVLFDITPYINIWSGTTYQTFSILISTDENDTNLLYFHSQEASNSPLGGSALKNCKFLGSGSTNYINIEGVRVVIGVSGPISTITPVDTDPAALERWSSFNASVATGSTFTMYSPDEEQGYVLGTVECTLLAKDTSTSLSSMTVSGISLPQFTEYFTTAEFSAVNTLPSGTGIIEVYSPSTQTVTDLLALNGNDILFVDYKETQPLNTTAFTVEFVSDERLKDNRIRIHVYEPVIAEDRTNLYTELSTKDIRPQFSVDLLV